MVAKVDTTIELNYLSIEEIASKYKDGSLKPSQLVQSYYDAYKKHIGLNAYVEFFENVLEEAKALDNEKVDPNNPLWGIGGATKDNFAIKGQIQSCCSKFLENYRSPYSATTVKDLQAKKSFLLGRASMDEFAMGASGLLSAFGAVKNFVNQNRLAGGSSSGSAVAVASGLATFALGSDTGGSVRVPASYNGIYGFKPTYGAISRYGVMTLAASLDVVGIMARSPIDVGYVFNALAHESSEDESTISVKNESFAVNKEINQTINLKDLKIAGFASMLKGCKPSVEKAYNKVKDWLISEGAIVEEINLDVVDILLKTYYLTVCSEASSSFARLDGIRFGTKVAGDTVEEIFFKSRSDLLGHELKRRVLLGNYFLKEENYNEFYNKALHIRNFLRSSMQDLSSRGFNLFLGPGFNEAPLINASEEDTYASDLLAVLANLYGGPAMAVPVLKGEEDLNVSVQFFGSVGFDLEVIRLSNMWHKASK